ncbi:unnamed protein product [Calicophoron daubneyi]|uniref:Deltamethrin resistance protein prag01 domain-containing protein n=1 Tax=Calicophoron daubneyi TaxID=300641 RepID=A0AAV2TCD4_CALDB
MQRFVAGSAYRLSPRVLLGVNHVRRHVPMRFPTRTMDDLEIPQGNWLEKHKELNASYNRFFLVSALICSISVGVVFYSMHPSKFQLPPSDNSPEGLKFLHPDKKALEYVLQN